ncbi:MULTISPECIES: protein bax [Buttiauxella]|jgi:Bax protein|nr:MULTISPECIES: protein bax [Buttiauxella]MRT12366.1 protein bax [Enterobacteriaceae bacterium RIT711]MCA1922142.1 protein bax [Buttiauxella noackiae]MCE0801702.1 protein bax [Buttiauxella sp. W03-F01]MCE0813237.1 protein bax [Buttiauxella sp. S04-F03]MCE0844597.1 protein bax [Buttiauxella sp. A2-C1_F]
MISTHFRRFGAAILMLLTFSFSTGVLASKHEPKSHKAHIVKTKSTTTHSKKLVSSKKEYSRNSEIASLPDLRKYPSGTPRKKAFLRTVMPYITSQNAAITADRNWLVSKQYEKRWSPSERTRLKGITQRYKIAWNGNTKRVPWNTLMEKVDIIPTNMVATMAAAESGWGTSKLARSNNNLFGMKCSKRHCNSEPGKVKGYLHYDSVKEGVNAYVTNLNTHPAYNSFRKSRAQLRKADQEVTASNMIHKLKGYSTKGSSYNNYLFAMYQTNQRFMAPN